MKEIVGLRFGSVNPSEPSGGQKCSWDLYTLLAERYGVHVLACKSILRRAATFDWGKGVRETVLPSAPLMGVYGLDRMLGTKETVFPPWAYTADIGLSVSRKRLVKKLFSSADLLLTETWLLYPLVMRYRKPGCRVLYRPQNVDSLFFGPLVPRWFWKMKKPAVEAQEGETVRGSDATLVLSEEDRQKLISLYKADPGKIRVVPMTAEWDGLDTECSVTDDLRKKYAPGGETVCLFLGTRISHNLEMARYIAAEVAPGLPDCVFLIVGDCAQALKGMELPANVKNIGFVPAEEFASVLSAVDIALNPVTFGSGVNVKMLNYLAAGLPTVTTPLGTRGLDLVDGESVLVSEPEGFARGIERLAGDRNLREAMAARALELARTRYSRKAVGALLESICSEFL